MAAHISGNVVPVTSPWINFMGPTGVNVFFLISGYIITSLSMAEVRQTGSFSQSKFMLRRALRILPPLWLYLAAMLVLHNISGLEPPGALRAAMFSCNIEKGPGNCGWAAGHTWTLAFEEQFYLLFPFLILRRFRLWVLPLVIFALLPFFWPLNLVGRIGHLQIWLLFGLGAAVATLEPLIKPRLIKLTPWLILPALVMLPMAYALPLSLGKTALMALAPFAILVVVFGATNWLPWLRRGLEAGWLTRIGLYSYSIYLWQQILLRPGGPQGPLYAVIAVATALGLGALSYHSFEKWFRQLSRAYGRPGGRVGNLRGPAA